MTRAGEGAGATLYKPVRGPSPQSQQRQLLPTARRASSTQPPTPTMKLILILSAVVVAALAVPQSGKDATIVELTNDNDGLGQYNFAYRTSDGIARQEQGALKNAGSENEAIEVQGSYTYKGVDGKDYTVTFVANENGYQPRVQS
ncbi:endocuticle structural glycoprotein SgAbd-5 [Schistocerca americana]|nr:endocuticle structural glycoprotein SgAbd-5 [Schistocerca americana]